MVGSTSSEQVLFSISYQH